MTGEPIADCRHRNTHHHGQETTYKQHGCRCEPCTAAITRASKRRRHLRLNGTPSWVDAEPVRQHVYWLMSKGLTAYGIAHIAGVSSAQMSRLLGRDYPKASTKIRAINAALLLSVKPDDHTDKTRVSAVGTQRRIRALYAIGWTGQHIADRLGCHRSLIQFWQQDTTTHVLGATADAIAEIYQQLHLTSGPSIQNVYRARKHGWLPPLAYDDDTIDDPTFDPVIEDADDIFDLIAVEEATKRRGVRLTHIEKAAAIDLMLQRGMTHTDISIHFGMSKSWSIHFYNKHGAAALLVLSEMDGEAA